MSANSVIAATHHSHVSAGVSSSACLLGMSRRLPWHLHVLRLVLTKPCLRHSMQLVCMASGVRHAESTCQACPASSLKSWLRVSVMSTLLHHLSQQFCTAHSSVTLGVTTSANLLSISRCLPGYRVSASICLAYLCIGCPLLN